MSLFTFAHHNCALPEPCSIAFFVYRLIHSRASHCLMSSKVSGEMETFEGASLGIGITRPVPDVVEDFLGFMLCHARLFDKPACMASSLRKRYSYLVLRVFSFSVGCSSGFLSNRISNSFHLGG